MALALEAAPGTVKWLLNSAAHSPGSAEEGKDLNMRTNGPFDVLDDVARDYIPDQTNLVPRVAARLSRKSPMTAIRTRPLVAVLMALLFLLALSGAAYA